MSTFTRSLRRSQVYGKQGAHGRRCISTNDDQVQEGDIVLLRRIRKPPLLTKPLKAGDQIGTNYGELKHNDIIGKSYRDSVGSSLGKHARIHKPTLGEYVNLTPRLVTPVYPADANLIVSLLDIHVDPPTQESNGTRLPFEILEAGTGHGALTLHLARAIHAANTSTPPAPRIISPAPTKGKAQPASPEPPIEDPNATAYEAWRRTRSAVISTLDISQDHSFHARKIVRGFRKGLYAGHVDFHVGDLGDFIDSECKRRGVSGHMFNHILLDLPGTHDYVAKAAQALRPDGCLVVFSPSVTQIASCVEVIRRLKLPLSYEQVVELGAGYGGGKQWDVRLTKARKPRVAIPEKVAEKVIEAPSSSWFLGMLRSLFRGDPSAAAASSALEPEAEKDMYHTVCRPLVGHKVIGGGFVGVWRRKKDWERFDEEDEVAS